MYCNVATVVKDKLNKLFLFPLVSIIPTPKISHFNRGCMNGWPRSGTLKTLLKVSFFEVAYLDYLVSQAMQPNQKPN